VCARRAAICGAERSSESRVQQQADTGFQGDGTSITHGHGAAFAVPPDPRSSTGIRAKSHMALIPVRETCVFFWGGEN